MTFSKFKRMQIAERNEFLMDAIREHAGSLRATAKALRMSRFVLCRHVKRFGLVENYGQRKSFVEAA